MYDSARIWNTNDHHAITVRWAPCKFNRELNFDIKLSKRRWVWNLPLKTYCNDARFHYCWSFPIIFHYSNELNISKTTCRVLCQHRWCQRQDWQRLLLQQQNNKQMPFRIHQSLIMYKWISVLLVIPIYRPVTKKYSSDSCQQRIGTNREYNLPSWHFGRLTTTDAKNHENTFSNYFKKIYGIILLSVFF